MSDKPLVSIIVPIYNVQPYIHQCIDSILAQTYTDTEIILVDDASPDNCPQICDNYAKEDVRVKVIHKENGGLSDARNAGIEAASGEWLAFVDSDDYVHEKFIEILVKAMQEQKSDISACSVLEFKDGNDLPMHANRDLQSTPTISHSPTEALKDFLSPRTKMRVTTWNKLYKKSLFIDHSIRFPVGRIHEDNFTTYKLFFYANKISSIDAPLYFYRQRKSSIMSSAFNERRLDAILAADELRTFFNDNKIGIESEVFYYKSFLTLGVINAYIDSSHRDRALYRKLREILRLSYTGISNKNVVLLHHHILMNVCMFSGGLYITVRRILNTQARRN